MNKHADSVFNQLMIKSLRDSLDVKEKENAELRKVLDAAADLVKHLNIAEDKSYKKLQQENAELRAERDKQKKLAELNFNCGLRQGQSDTKHIFERSAKAKDEYLAENENLTNMLLKVEEERDLLLKYTHISESLANKLMEVKAERDALRARIDAGIRVSAQKYSAYYVNDSYMCFKTLHEEEADIDLNATLILDEGVNLDA